MFSIFIKEVKRILKDKSTMIGLLVLPMVLIFIFGNVLNNATDKIEIHYVDNDQTSTSRAYVKEITQGNTFVLVKEKSKSEALEKIKKGDLASFVYIPKGFKEKAKKEEQIQIEMHYDGIQMESAGVVRNLINATSAKFRENNILKELEVRVTDPKEFARITEYPIVVEEKEYATQDIQMMTRMIPSYMIFFLFFMILNMSKAFVKDKETGMLTRLQTTPMKIKDYMMGMMFAYGTLMFVQILLMLFFGNLVYDISLGNVLLIVLHSFLTVLCVASIGLFVSMIAKNEQMANAISQAIAMIGAGVGGVLIPSELLPSAVKELSVFVPQYWAQKGYLDIMTREVSSGEMGITFVTLLGFSLGFMILARLCFKTFIRKATH